MLTPRTHPHGRDLIEPDGAPLRCRRVKLRSPRYVELLPRERSFRPPSKSSAVRLDASTSVRHRLQSARHRHRATLSASSGSTRRQPLARPETDEALAGLSKRQRKAQPRMLRPLHLVIFELRPASIGTLRAGNDGHRVLQSEVQDGFRSQLDLLSPGRGLNASP